ncbi:MAG: RIP metalloprotease RseP [Pseudomonadales bacterium]
MEIVQTIAVTIFTLGVLVTFHEYGHFWVARRNGIKVLRFSIGFGKPLITWYDKQGTEFVIAAIPLGGYVKMLDEREGEVDPGEIEQAFTQKSVYARIAVVIAGPAANLLLAVFVLWLGFLAGERGVAPVIDAVAPDSPAAQAGLTVGQEIVAIDGHETPTWRALSLRLLERIGESGTLSISSKYPDSDLIYDADAELKNWLQGQEEPDLFAGLGVTLFRPKVELKIDEIVPNSAADQAGLRRGDEILMSNGQLMETWDQWVEYVQQHPEQAINVQIMRNGESINLDLTPQRVVGEDGREIGRVGVKPQIGEWPEYMLRDYDYSIWGAAAAAVARTWQLSKFTLQSIKKMLFGQISAKNLSGPITIAKVAGDSAQSGWQSYLGFLALLSVSLGVLNLLPIPVLDGGHLLFYLIELVKGSPLSDRIQIAGQQIGLLMLAGVMLLAFYNDFSRL